MFVSFLDQSGMLTLMKWIQFNRCYLIVVIKHNTIYKTEVKTRAILYALCHSDANLNFDFSDTYSKVCIKRPVLLNDLVKFFSKSLY